MKTKTQSRYTYFFKRKRGKNHKYLKCKSIHSFNRSGKLLEIIYYWATALGARPSLDGKVIFEYDSMNQCVGYRGYDLESQCRLREKMMYVLDNNGRRVKSAHTIYGFKDDPIEETISEYRYNKAGNCVWERTDGGKQGYDLYEYEYGEENEIKEERLASSRKSNEYSCTYIHSKDKTIKIYNNGCCSIEFHNSHYGYYKSYDIDGRLVNMLEKKYDKHGHLVYKKHMYFDCDCTGVRIIPSQLEILEYEYY